MRELKNLDRISFYKAYVDYETIRDSGHFSRPHCLDLAFSAVLSSANSTIIRDECNNISSASRDRPALTARLLLMGRY
jgi:hypothetical protein